MGHCKHKKHRHEKSNPYTESDWYIDPKCGDDKNQGTDCEKPLKSYAEWQARVGVNTVLCPKDDVLTIHLLNDLPQCDPITFDNVLGPNATAIIQGQEIIIGENVLTNVIEKNRSANIPNTIGVATASYWADKIGLFVFIENSEKHAIIARDLGNGEAHMGSWGGENFGGFVTSESSPSIGQALKVVDFTKAYVGRLQVSATFSADDSGEPGPPGGLLLKNIHFLNTGPLGFTELPTHHVSALASGGFANCIFDATIVTNLHNDLFIGNCSIRGGMFMFTGATTVFMTQSVFTSQEGLPAGLLMDGGKLVAGDDQVFVNCDLAIRGAFVDSGPMSFWDGFNAIIVNDGGRMHFQAFDPLFGEFGFVPQWGEGTINANQVKQNGSFVIDQFNVGTPPPLPSFSSQADPIAWTWNGDLMPWIPENQGHPFVPDLADYSPLRDNTWANLAIPYGAGGFVSGSVVSPTEIREVANARAPGISAQVIRNSFTFLP